jgi:phage regulator Rha-like protein
MTSREIAALTGKHHFHVTTDILKMLVELGEDATAFRDIYVDSMNRPQIGYALNRELTDTLLTGYSAKLRRVVIARWHELEAEKAGAVLNTDESRLLMIQELATKQLALIHENKQIAIERDHAIATKAQIGSKREATSMATASAARKESAKLKEQLGFNADHATVTAVQNATGEKFDWLPMRRWCKLAGLPPKDVQDKRYGTVKAWPAAAWMKCYAVSLDLLFGEVAA